MLQYLHGECIRVFELDKNGLFKFPHYWAKIASNALLKHNFFIERFFV